MRGEVKMKNGEKNFKDEIGYLKNSPIYAMSLGSKELFHSNFWAWLMRKDKGFVKVFFNKIDDKLLPEKENFGYVKREEKNRDITIHTKDGIYIIENKIKTLPYVEQLAKYQIEAGKNFKGGVIAALKEPNFDCKAEYNVTVNKKDYIVDVQKKAANVNEYSFKIKEKQSVTSCESMNCSDTSWKFMNYSDIKDGIFKKIVLLKCNRDKTVTEMYCETVENLCKIVSEKLNEIDSNQAKWNFDDAKDFEKIKFDDVYKKLKLDILKEQILEELKKDNYIDRSQISENQNFIFRVETAYSNKQPSISFKFVYKESDKVTDIYSFGIQIQNGGIRRYAETKVGKMKNLKEGYDGFFNAFAGDKCKWFDNEFVQGNDYLCLSFDNNESRKLKTHMSPQIDNKKKNKKSSQYNAYTDFVYQYYNIGDEIKVEALAEEIKENLKYAKSICDEVKKFFDDISEE